VGYRLEFQIKKETMTGNWKIIRFGMLTILLSLSGTGCRKDHLFDCTKSTGKEITINRSIAGFDELYISDNVDVVLKKGSAYSVRVTAGGQLIDGIITEKQGNKLYIRNENRCNWVRDLRNKYTVELTIPTELKHIYYDGSGDITAEDSLGYDGFLFECWNGSGDIRLLLNSENSFLKINLGRCLIMASGKVTNNYIYLHDVGVVHASGLIAENTTVKNSSTGNAEVYATNRISAEIEHTGSIYYTGNPQLIDLNRTGSGNLIPR
jgi:hypothetical protein